MKTVFTNSMTAHVWAQQTQPKGRSNNSNLYFEGRTIYSYGRHFPIASYISDNIILVNSDKYSSSTGKHQNYVRRAISDDKQRYYFNTNVMQCAAMWNVDDHGGATSNLVATVIRETLKHAERDLKEGATKRLERMRLAALDSVINSLQYAKEFIQNIGGDATALIEKQNELTWHGAERLATFKAEFKAEQERRVAASKQAAIERANQLKNVIPLWRLNNNLAWSDKHLINTSDKIYLRLIGENVETSKGATFPIEHARRAYNFVKDAMLKERTFTANSSLPAPRLGHFKIDSIDKHGTVKAGCHVVEYDEIEYIAKQLDIA